MTTIAEAQAGGHATPGPSYQVPEQNVFKRRSESVQFGKGKTCRLDRIVRTEQTDFFETSAAAIKNSHRRSPTIGFSKE